MRCDTINDSPPHPLPPTTHHDVVVHEALAVAGRLEVRVLLGAGDLDVPHAPPGLVELQVDWVDARVVGSHGVAHVHWDAVLLQPPQTQAKPGVAHINIRGTAALFTTADKGHGGT